MNFGVEILMLKWDWVSSDDKVREVEIIKDRAGQIWSSGMRYGHMR